MEIVILWLAFSIAAGMWANSKGRSGLGYFLLSVILSPLVGLIFAGIASDKRKEDQATPETHVRCPDCKELVRKDARKCKHCGCSLIPQ